MKKMLKVWFFAVLVIFSSVIFAEDEKVSTSITLKNDWSFPENGKSSSAQKLSTYWSYKSFGGGMDICFIKKTNNYFSLEPYLTYGNGPWFLVGGFSLDNSSRYAETGFWYIKTFGKLNAFLDVRNYFATSGKAEDYLDNFLELKHPLNDKFYAGIDLEFIRYWEGGGNWYMIAPLIGYNINQNISIFTRISRDWSVVDNQTSQSDRIRLALKMKF
jgi:hypothetical protein